MVEVVGRVRWSAATDHATTRADEVEAVASVMEQRPQRLTIGRTLDRALRDRVTDEDDARARILTEQRGRRQCEREERIGESAGHEDQA